MSVPVSMNTKDQESGADLSFQSTDDPVRRFVWIWLALLAAVSLTAFAASQARHPAFSAGRVAVWWGASVLLVLLMAIFRDAAMGHRLVLSRPRLRRALMWIGLTILAALPRLAMLDRFPTILDADEGAFIAHAVEFQRGQMPNPFGTGFFSTPLLYLAAQGIVAGNAMDGIGEYRHLSAFLGTIGVLATWRLGRRIVEPTGGLIAGVLLAGWPLHLYFSRSALNNITDPTFLVLALLFLLRGMETRRALDAVLSGLSLAGAVYGYYGGRAMWAVALASLIALVVVERRVWRDAMWAAGWMVSAFVVAAMPLLVTFHEQPAELAGHLDALDDQRSSSLGGWLGRVTDALLYPVAGNDQGFFRHDPPFIGWPLTLLVVAGVIAVTGRSIVRRDGRPLALLLVPYILLCAGIALTDPLMSQRFSAVIPLLAIVAGAGLAWLARLAAQVVPGGGEAARLVVALLVGVSIGVGNVRWLASENRQEDAYGDRRTTMMWDIGWRLREGEDGTSRLLLAGAPYVYANGFANLNVLAPDVVQEDVPGQFVGPADAPPLSDGTILVLVPERLDERCAIEAAYPVAVIGEARDQYGTLLYVSFSSGMPQGWSDMETPAGTTWTKATASPCDSA